VTAPGGAVPTLLVLGAHGQVGFELVRSLAPLGRVVAMTRAECDLADPVGAAAAVRAAAPSVVVNAAAYTAVDRAEEEPSCARA
jgi:dTDP-4-dehydrorhamnose reductase